jgi:hypothetical protein
MFIASLIESPFLDTRMWQKRKTQLANFDQSILHVICRILRDARKVDDPADCRSETDSRVPIASGVAREGLSYPNPGFRSFLTGNVLKETA